MKVWQGRFSQSNSQLMEAFNASIGFDVKLMAYDIQSSQAHVSMLCKIGLITMDERDIIVSTLNEILSDFRNGKISFSLEDEDVHMAIENELVKRVGDVGKKMHTARSRNDQVATDMRMYAADQSYHLIEALKKVMSVLLKHSETYIQVTMPGFTHLQKAQPILLSFYLNAYCHMFKRDIERLEDGLKRILVLPLGSGALSGVNYPLDRHDTTNALGFNSFSMNALDAVSDRDFVIELLHAIAICIMHFSRLSEDLIIWNSEPYNFVTMSDLYATGSSMMPQKKNPDACELTRGKTGRIFGHLMGILTVMKGLPMSYNKDMQEDKEGLFDSVDTILTVCQVFEGMLSEITFNTDVMKNSLKTGYLNATDLADYLVKKGVSFRTAHHITGAIVKEALTHNCTLEDLDLNVFKTYADVIEKDVYDVLKMATENKASFGSTNVTAVKDDIKMLRIWIEGVK